MNDNTIKELSADLKEYAQVQTRIFELEITSKVSSAGSSVLSATLIAFVLLSAFLFMNLGLGFYLSDLLDSYPKGFLAVGLFYSLLAAILLIFRRALLQSPLRDRIISSMSR